MRFRDIYPTMILLLVLAACAPPDEQAPDEPAAAGDHGSIAWFEGSVEDAFAFAKEENKPLFLYWGAVWCPPCHYLKTKIFTREEFIAQTRGVVPVYLDGDTERAQIYGERFGAKGYPTVILFNPAGREITRLPSTLPVDRYAEVLERAISRMRPVKEIFDDVAAAGPAAADPIDLNLLAFYAWGQDAEVQLPAEEKLETFRRLYRQTPAELAAERSRFLNLYLTEAIRRSRDDDGDAVLEDGDRDELRVALAGLLADPELRTINLDLLLYWSRESIELLTVPSAGREVAPQARERQELITAWKNAARAVEADDALPVDDRLSALMPRLWLTRLELEEGAPETGDEATSVVLPEPLRDEVRERIAWAGEAVTDQGELQAVMSTMAALLEEAALTDEAETLLSERLEDTAAPYYYMSWIAGMKREKGEDDEALKWYRQAYDSASGRYTRFRWGSLYLRQRIQLAPDDVATLEGESLAILDELLSFDDAFAGGNYTRLGQLESALEAWHDDGGGEELIAAIRARVHAACDRYPEGGEDAQRSRCRAFLEAEASTAA